MGQEGIVFGSLYKRVGPGIYTNDCRTAFPESWVAVLICDRVGLIVNTLQPSAWAWARCLAAEEWDYRSIIAIHMRWASFSETLKEKISGGLLC